MAEPRDDGPRALRDAYRKHRGLNRKKGEDRNNSGGPIVSDNAESSIPSLPQVFQRVANLETRQEDDRSRLDNLEQQRHEDVANLERRQQEDRSRISILETQRHKDVANLQKQREEDRSRIDSLQQQRQEDVANLERQQKWDRHRLKVFEKQRQDDIADLKRHQEADRSRASIIEQQRHKDLSNLQTQREEDHSRLVALEKQQQEDVANLQKQREKGHSCIEKLAANFQRQREEDQFRFVSLEEQRREDSQGINHLANHDKSLEIKKTIALHHERLDRLENQSRQNQEAAAAQNKGAVSPSALVQDDKSKKLKAEVSSLGDRIGRGENERQELSQQQNKQAKDHAALIELVRQEKKKHDKATAKLQELIHILTGLQMQIGESNKDSEEKTARRRAIEQEIRQLRAGIQSLTNWRKAAESAIGTQRKEIQDLQSLQKQSEQKITALTADRNNQKSTIENLQSLQVKSERTIVAMKAVSNFQRATIDDMKTHIMRQVDVRSFRVEKRANRSNTPSIVVERQSRAYTDEGTNTSARIPSTTMPKNGNGRRSGGPDDVEPIQGSTRQAKVQVTNTLATRVPPTTTPKNGVGRQSKAPDDAKAVQNLTQHTEVQVNYTSVARIPSTTKPSNGNWSQSEVPDDTNAVQDPTQQIEVQVPNACDTAGASGNLPFALPSFQELLFDLTVFWMFPLAIGHFTIVSFLRGFWLFFRPEIFGEEAPKSDAEILHLQMGIDRVVYHFCTPIFFLLVVLEMVYNTLLPVLVKFLPGLLKYLAYSTILGTVLYKAIELFSNPHGIIYSLISTPLIYALQARAPTTPSVALGFTVLAPLPHINAWVPAISVLTSDSDKLVRKSYPAIPRGTTPVLMPLNDTLALSNQLHEMIQRERQQLESIHFQTSWIMRSMDKSPSDSFSSMIWRYGPAKFQPSYQILDVRMSETINVLNAMEFYYNRTSSSLDNTKFTTQLNTVSRMICRAEKDIGAVRETYEKWMKAKSSRKPWRDQYLKFARQTEKDAHLICEEVKHDVQSLAERQQQMRREQVNYRQRILNMKWLQQEFISAGARGLRDDELRTYEEKCKDVLEGVKRSVETWVVMEETK